MLRLILPIIVSILTTGLITIVPLLLPQLLLRMVFLCLRLRMPLPRVILLRRLALATSSGAIIWHIVGIRVIIAHDFEHLKFKLREASQRD